MLEAASAMFGETQSPIIWSAATFQASKSGTAEGGLPGSIMVPLDEHFAYKTGGFPLPLFQGV